MDNIILGLLLLSSRTIYQLRDRIDKGLNLMYSSSLGSIQAAVKKLLSYGYIGYEEIVENGKYKKIYSISESGKQHFFAWVNSPIDVQHSKNPELAKLYFMGFSDPKCRETSIQAHLDYLNEQYRALNAICAEANGIQVADEHRDILLYQVAAARYGRDFVEFNINWYKSLLAEIRGERL